MAVAQITEMLQALTRGMAAEASVVSDRELVRRFLESGGEDAFEILVRRHGPMVYRVCWRVAGHDQDAEDAFQATFLVLARDLRTLHNLPSLASWLHGVARRVALKAKERAAARRRREQLSSARESAPPADPARAEVSAVLDEELSRLPERWRLPLVLCYLEQRTQDEAARELGWAKRTLRRRLDEARAALATRLARRGVWPAVLAGVVLSDCAAPAALPRALVGPTVHAAAAVAARHTSAAAVAEGVSTLTEGVFNVSQSKLKFAVAVFVAGALALGAGAILQVSSATPPVGNEAPKTANLPAPQPAPKNAEKADANLSDELKQWQGRWRVVRAEVEGKLRKDECVGFDVIEVVGKKLTVYYRNVNGRDPSDSAEVTGELKLIPRQLGKGTLADDGFIFQYLIPITGNWHFTNGQLVLCFCEPGTEEGRKRPVGFGSWENSKRHLYRLERVAEEKQPAKPGGTPIEGPKKRVGSRIGELGEPPPPDIAGRWYGAEWGHVELAMSKPGTYVGTYDDTFGPVKGSITLEWLPLEQRYQGKWGEGKDRFGTISVRPYGREIRGAFTADPACKLRPGTPDLSDLKWIPQSAVK